MSTPTINVNGAVLTLSDNGTSGAGKQRLKAEGHIPGFGRVFITVYSEAPVVDVAPVKEIARQSKAKVKTEAKPAPITSDGQEGLLARLMKQLEAQDKKLNKVMAAAGL